MSNSMWKHHYMCERCAQQVNLRSTRRFVPGSSPCPACIEGNLIRRHSLKVKKDQIEKRQGANPLDSYTLLDIQGPWKKLKGYWI